MNEGGRERVGWTWDAYGLLVFVTVFARSDCICDCDSEDT